MEQDPNEMMDPNLLNPLSKQGYGKEDPPAIRNQNNKKQDKSAKDAKKAAEEAYKNRSMGEQTMQAALQMGVLVKIKRYFLFKSLISFIQFNYVTLPNERTKENS